MSESRIKYYANHPEAKEKQTETMRKRWLDPKEREKQREVASNRWSDPKEREKQSKIASDRWLDTNEREKQREVALKRWSNPEEKDAQSKRLLGRWSNIENKEKQSELVRGENHPNWKGGISFAPYCEKFNNEFRERVRYFYGRTCVNCGKDENQNGRRLTVHHVNYDKMVCCNDVKPLFVSICISCNSKANKNREWWEKYYTNIIDEKYGGKCYFTKEEMSDFFDGKSLYTLNAYGKLYTTEEC